MSVFDEDVYTLFLHLTVNGQGIAYRLEALCVDKAVCRDSKEDLSAETDSDTYNALN